MKKLAILLFCLLLLTGCGSKQKLTEKKVIDLSFDDDSYQVYEPWKKGKGNNYVVNNILNNYDLSEVENNLMRISTSYFKTKTTYYQEGQYLSESELKELLDQEHLNQADKIKINGKEVEPTYITYIHEQNYLSSSGKLKGISLAMVLSPYQNYLNENGVYQYQTVDSEGVLSHGKEKAKELIRFLRAKKGLEKVKIIVALYLQNNPDESLPGEYRYVGLATNDDISFEEVKYQYRYLDSIQVAKDDAESYNIYQNLKQKINEQFTGVYPVAKALYINDRIQEVEITLTTSYLSKSELLLLNQLTTREIGNFQTSILVKVYTKEDNEMTSLVVKRRNSKKSNAYMMK